MRTLRLLLFCFLSLAIPVQGFAGVTPLEPPCPMEHPAMNADAAEPHSCCNDAETYAKTGKSCKTGDQCHTVFQFPGYLPSVNSAIHAQPQKFLVAVPSAPATNPSSIWRPPSFS